jgi:hypothetical protein
MDNLYNLIKSFYHVCDIFNQMDITYWVDWGTLLGYMRNKSVIPWDYDIDLCILDSDYEKMIDFFQKNKDKLDLICDVDYYDDKGCCALYLKELYSPENRFECLSIDVIRYKITDLDNNKKLKSCMVEETILKYSNPTQNIELYDFDYDDIFPLKQVIMCGVMVCIPNNSEKIVKNNYGENCIDDYKDRQEYLDFIKSNDNNEKLIKFISCPFREIAKIDNFKDGIKFYENNKRPFLIKNSDDFSHITPNLIKNYLSKEGEIFSHNNNNSFTYKSGEKYIDEWNNNILETNLVDTPVINPFFFPDYMQKMQSNIIKEKKEYAFCYNLTKQNNFTNFHTDPPYGDGWMFLAEGNKIWYIISKEDTIYILNNGYKYEDIEKMKFYDIIFILDGYLWGKIYVDILEANKNNFLYFEEDSFHSVQTYKKTIGVCGYIRI